MKMKIILAASAMAFSAITPLKAADIIRDVVVVQEQPIMAFTPMFSWTGVYVGAQVGGVLGDTGLAISGQPGGGNFAGVNKDFTPDPTGFLGGLYAGYNFNFNDNIVFGLETDVAFASASESKNWNGGDDDTQKINANVKERWSGATRARLGYASNRWMPYIAAGLAYAQLETNIAFGADASSATAVSGDKTMMGYTVGAGLDYGITQNLLLRAEYRYSDYGNKTYGNDSFDYKVDYTTNDLRVGLAYKF